MSLFLLGSLITLRKKIFTLSVMAGIFLVATIWMSYTSLNNVLNHFEDFRTTSEFAKHNIALAK
ncbi:hypothetical protein N9A28_10115, partial [Sulfurimonas sp.]|nr:hypothetical protein [Sulfurimonas sp.]